MNTREIVETLEDKRYKYLVQPVLPEFVARPLTMDGLRCAYEEFILEGLENLVEQASQECPHLVSHQ